MHKTVLENVNGTRAIGSSVLMGLVPTLYMTIPIPISRKKPKGVLMICARARRPALLGVMASMGSLVAIRYSMVSQDCCA